MAKLDAKKRQAIAADVRAGEMTREAIAERHGVSRRTVYRVAADLPPLDEASNGARVLDLLERITLAAERTLETAMASGNSREMSAAMRACQDALKTVGAMRRELEAEVTAHGTQEEVEAMRRIVLEECDEGTRLRVAARFMVEHEKKESR